MEDTRARAGAIESRAAQIQDATNQVEDKATFIDRLFSLGMGLVWLGLGVVVVTLVLKTGAHKVLSPVFTWLGLIPKATAKSAELAVDALVELKAKGQPVPEAMVRQIEVDKQDPKFRAAFSTQSKRLETTK